MIKLRVSYATEQEKDKLLLLIKSVFRLKKEPKPYKEKGPCKYMRMDLFNK